MEGVLLGSKAMNYSMPGKHLKHCMKNLIMTEVDYNQCFLKTKTRFSYFLYFLPAEGFLNFWGKIRDLRYFLYVCEGNLSLGELFVLFSKPLKKH